ncbi:trypsin-like serine peptidase [Bdellovibrio sp. HCB337]|uniref:trypsin-like serine peptidase n=1 Tax=Bdellovibrio sp. HCB337 TaxID=3394358 RepID=UPI0039A76161
MRLGICIILTFLSLHTQAANWTSIYPTAKTSIPMIMSSGGLCAGTLIDKDLILTAAHCVYRLRPVHVSWPEKPKEFEGAKVVSLNRKADLALIQLHKPSTRVFLTLLPKGKRMPEGSPIATIGHPSIGRIFDNPPFDVDMTYLMSTGIISGWAQDEFISDMSVSPGNSGGPVFSEEGQVIGVVSRKRVDRFVGAIGFSASLDKVHEMLDNYKANKLPEVTWRQASSSGKVYLAYSSHQFLKDYGGPIVWYLGALMDYKDRIRFELATNFSSTRNFTNYSMGYKWATEMENHGMIYISPTVEFVHYRLEQENDTELKRNSTGLGLSLALSSFPISLKYIGFNMDGEYRGITSFQFGF